MGNDQNSPVNEGQHSESRPDVRLDDNAWCLIIAFIQVAGGILGIGLFIYELGAMPNSLLLTLVFAPFVYGVYAGYLLWQGKVKGLNHSLIVQAIQVPKFVFSLVGYHLQLGIELNIGWFGSKGEFDLHFGSSSFISINPPSDSYGVGINLIALAALYYLWTLKRKLDHISIKKENSQPEK